MGHFVTDSYNGVMNARYNPLRYGHNQYTRHLIMLGLAWMWCIIFAVWSGLTYYPGISIFYHSLLLFGLFVTVGTFKLASRSEH